MMRVCLSASVHTGSQDSSEILGKKEHHKGSKYHLSDWDRFSLLFNSVVSPCFFFIYCTALKLEHAPKASSVRSHLTSPNQAWHFRQG